MAPELIANTPSVADEAGEEEVDELEGPDEYTGDRADSVESDGPATRKAKRARSSASKPKAPRKKYVRGKQGGLQGIMKMPLEIFTEIAYHITPGDLIVLIRCNKFFRAMLLRRSAILIWQRAAQNVPGLPPCPTGMCEPQYAALMFSKTCTLCGATATAKPDPYLQVRLCSTCRDTKLEPWSQRWLKNGTYLVPYSHVSRVKVTGRQSRYSRIQYYCLRHELDEARRKSEELLRSKDQSAFDNWMEEKRENIRLRSIDADLMQEYIASVGKSHGEELEKVRTERRQMIHDRLLALGWTASDLEFHHGDTKAWNALIEISKPLTDRTWTNLLPKLLPLLEEDRDLRLKYERVERRVKRRRHLHKLFSEIRRNEHPFGAAIELLNSDSGLAVPPPVDPLSSPFSSTKRREPIIENPFPPTATVLDWECLRDLSEMEVGIERIEELFKERREQFDLCLAEWREGLEKRLVEIFEDGAEEAAVEGEETRAEPIVKVKGSTDSTKHLPPNVRLLLRADTIFKEKPTESSEDTSDLFFDGRRSNVLSLCHYPSIIAPRDYFYEYVTMRNSPPPEVNPEKYVRYTKIEKLVRKLLADMGMPDVARVELDALKARFACGRCTERMAMTWDQIVKHYVQLQREWEKDSRATGEHSTRHPVLFRNVHDVEWTTNPKPLVRLLTVEEAAQSNGGSSLTERFWCLLCKGTGKHHLAGVEDVRVHLQDVHGVAEPTEGLCYRSDNARQGSPLSDYFSDAWHKEWDAFHDAQVASAVASAVDPLSVPPA